MSIAELNNKKREAEAELLAINHKIYELKVRKAKAEKIIDQTDYELYRAQGKKVETPVAAVSDFDITGH